MSASWRSTVAFGHFLRDLLHPSDSQRGRERDSNYGFRLFPPLTPHSPSDRARVYVNPTSTRSPRRASHRRAVALSLCFVLMLLGLLHIAEALLSTADTQPSRLTSTIRFPNALHSAQPVPCHSHNDYWRPRPLLDALALGCSSVEADVWLFDGQLYIGHGLASVDRNKSLRTMYLEPLLRMLESRTTPETAYSPTLGKPGIFDQQPNQTVVLLVEFKNNGLEAFQYLNQDLEPFRAKDYLTYHDGEKRVNGPITVVVTGHEAPFHSILANTTHRDIFVDAPLQNLWQPPRLPLPDSDERTLVMDYGSAMADGLQPAIKSPEPYNEENSFYASASFRSAVGYVWRGHLSPRQMRIIRGQIRGARSRGLKVRYWDTPTWPIELRNHIWHVLSKEGADVLSVDDVEGCARASWRRTHNKKGWFGS